MTETPAAGKAYPFAVVATATGFAASALQFPAMATAPTRTQLDRLMREQSALYLLEHRLNRTSPERPRAEGDVDLSDWVDADPPPTVVFAAPAAVNEVSIAIELAVRDEGLTYAELARCMALPRSVVTRLTDPFYFGHTTATLRKVAHALGRALHVSFAVDRGVRASAASTD